MGVDLGSDYWLPVFARVNLEMRCIVSQVVGLLLVLLASAWGHATSLAETIVRVKPAVVGVGSHTPLGRPQNRLEGTGFAVADGYHVITNAHVVSRELDQAKGEKRVIFVGQGKAAEIRSVRVLARDDTHDLALLRITGNKLPVFTLGDSKRVREGELYAFTGFPIGPVLGLYPVTHQGIISSISPVVIPARTAGQLNAKMINTLKHPYLVFQLDAVAYPGNSGSPLYHPETGVVIGVINKVLVQGNKESVLANPTGITYAIPGRHVLNLLKKRKVE